jgi:hypothetical protein
LLTGTPINTFSAADSACFSAGAGVDHARAAPGTIASTVVATPLPDFSYIGMRAMPMMSPHAPIYHLVSG